MDDDFDDMIRFALKVAALVFVPIVALILWMMIFDPFGTKAAGRDRTSELACMKGGNFWVEGECRPHPRHRNQK